MINNTWLTQKQQNVTPDLIKRTIDKMFTPLVKCII